MSPRAASQGPYTLATYNPETSLGRLVAEVSGRLLAALDDEMTELGITGAQWVILMRIADGRGSTAAELCRHSRYDTGSMTRMLDRLEEKGLIRRVRSASDRRRVHLELTPAGRLLHPQLPPVAVKVLNAHLRGFSQEEVALLTVLLQRMLANADLPATAS